MTTAGAVDDEVDGGVEAQHRVGDLADGANQRRFVDVTEAEERGEDGVGGDADAERDDGGDEHDGDAMTRDDATVAAETAALRAQLAYDEAVENDENGERQEAAHYM